MNDILIVIVVAIVTLVVFVLIFIAARRDSNTINSTEHKNEAELKVRRRISENKKPKKELGEDDSKV